MGKKGTQIGRDATTGQFIPVKDAIRRPGRTVVETIKKGGGGKGGKKK